MPPEGTGAPQQPPVPSQPAQPASVPPASSGGAQEQAGSTGGTTPTGAAHPGTPAAQPEADSPRFSQADLDRKIEERLARERAKAAEAQAKATGQWETLATERQARISELEAAAQTRETETDDYRKALARINRETVKDWPEEARGAVAKSEDPLVVAASIDNLRPLVARLGAGTAPVAPRPGVPASPRPAGGTTPHDQAVQAEIDRLRATSPGYTPA